MTIQDSEISSVIICFGVSHLQVGATWRQQLAYRWQTKAENIKALKAYLQFSEVLISVGLMQVDRKQYNLPSNELIWSLEQRGLSLGISGEF